MKSFEPNIIKLNNENVLESVSGGRGRITDTACVVGALSAALAAAAGAVSGVYFLKSMDAFAPNENPDKPGENKENPNVNNLNNGGKLPKANPEAVSNLAVTHFKKSKKWGKVALGLLGAAGVGFGVAALSDIR